MIRISVRMPPRHGTFCDIIIIIINITHNYYYFSPRGRFVGVYNLNLYCVLKRFERSVMMIL